MIRRFVLISLSLTLFMCSTLAHADKDHKDHDKDQHWQAQITDAEGMQTDVKDVKFYWEEKIDETSFVPHEERHLSVKHGKATIEIGLKKIQTIDILPKQDGQTLPVVRIMMDSGTQGEFPLARAVSLIGHSEFGKFQVPLGDLTKIELK